MNSNFTDKVFKDLIELSKFSKINLIHRRDEFRGAINSVQKINKLSQKGKINLITKYQLKSVNGSDNLQSIDIINDDKVEKNLKTDFVRFFWTRNATRTNC